MVNEGPIKMRGKSKPNFKRNNEVILKEFCVSSTDCENILTKCSQIDFDFEYVNLLMHYALSRRARMHVHIICTSNKCNSKLSNDDKDQI